MLLKDEGTTPNIKYYCLFLQLSKFAQEWADKLARENRFDHRPNNQYGENLYCSWSSNPKRGVSQI